MYHSAWSASINQMGILHPRPTTKYQLSEICVDPGSSCICKRVSNPQNYQRLIYAQESTTLHLVALLIRLRAPPFLHADRTPAIGVLLFSLNYFLYFLQVRKSDAHCHKVAINYNRTRICLNFPPFSC